MCMMIRLHILILMVALVMMETSASNNVPVVFWTNIRNKECPVDIPTYPGEYILKFTESEYFRCLLDAKPATIKMFLLKELEIPDFSINRKDSNVKAFHNLENFLKSTSSVVLPDVQNTDIGNYLTASLQHAFEGASVFVKELPEIRRDNSDVMQDSISEIDEIIQHELDLEAGEYIAILTAEASPQVRVPRDVESIASSRQLLANEEESFTNKTTFIDANCIYINYESISLVYNKITSNLTGKPEVTSNCNLSNTSRSIDMKFTNGSDSDINIKLIYERKQFPVSKKTWWVISSAVVTHSLNKSTVDYEMNNTDTYAAPIGWSWVCESPVIMTWRPSKKDEVKMTLQFENIQMQPFEISNSSFSRPLDCSGFLTGPIWMGILISLLLAGIFAFGLYMMAGMTTMDRFDDPRGKPMLVHTTHDQGN